MNIFDRDISVIEAPWPHIVIPDALPPEMADYMRDHFPPTELTPRRGAKRHGDYMDDPVFAEFHRSIHDNKAEIFTKMDDLFDQPSDDLFVARALFRNHEPDSSHRLIRDWHVDDASKKYKFLLYLGEGDGGWFEMINPITKEVKRYDFKHNQIIAFHNAVVSVHRFYTSSIHRKTVGFSFGFVDSSSHAHEPALADRVVDMINGPRD